MPTLIQVGNSKAAIIPKTMLQAMGVANDTEFSVTTDGRRIILTPETVPTKAQTLIPGLIQRYRPLLKMLERA